MTNSRTLIALLLLAFFLAAIPADARRRRRRHRHKKPLTPAAKVYAEGKTMFKAKDYVGALEAFEKAHELRPHFLVQCNIARCYERLGRMVQAAEHYRRCLTDGAGKTRQARKIKRALKQVESRVTWIEVESPGEGGTVYVNGQEMGPTGMPISVNPGTAVVEVRRKGATPAQTTVKARGGKTIKLTLIPKTIAVARPPPGPDPPDKPRPDKPVEPERKGLSQVWFWIGAAVTVALTLTYVITGAQALRLKSDYEESPTRDGYNDAIARRTLSNVFFGLAGAAAGTTTVLFFFTDFGGASKGKERAPDLDDEVVFGLGLRGTF